MSKEERRQSCFVILMGLITSGAFCINSILSDSTGTIIDFLRIFYTKYDGQHLETLFLCLGVCAFYWMCIRKINLKFSKSILVISFVFSLITSIYASMSEFYIVQYPNIFIFLWHLIGYILFYYIIISCIFEYFDTPVKSGKWRENVSDKKMFVLVSLTVFLLWVPYVIMCLPGNIMYDTGTSIMYFLGISRENVNNPFFQTFLYGCIYKIGVLFGNVNIGVFFYNLVQLCAYILVISYSVVLLKKKKVPQYLLVGVVLLYGLLPIFPVYAFTMGKDSNFALCLMTFCVLIFELISDNQSFFDNNKKISLLFITAVLLGLLRNQAYLIVVICLCGCYFVQSTKKNKKIIGIALFLVLIVNLVFPRLVQIPKTDVSENLSIPLQQTAYYVNRYADEITEEEQEIIDEVIPYDAMQLYNPGISDPIKDKFKDSADKKALLNYLKVWCKHLINHPTAYLKAYYYGSYAYYSPDAERSDLKSHIFAGYTLDEDVYKETQLQPNKNIGIELVKKIDNMITKLPIIGLFQKIGIYSWMVVLMFFYLMLKKKFKYVLCICPLLFVFIGDCCSPVNGYFRYAFPMIVCVPVICLAVIFELKKEH
ncbi:DUF6020 family protein [Faecalicatena contorta]|uniref:DUF6020 family protein n=1 Tax=Faecalicatena contorta TaxID=39482 RepID=UPI001F23B814|nr:DUF6020 family protein [Faecalicatena contorta]MCF2555210.1 hypothetical protein [Faecalicatena contorta]